MAKVAEIYLHEGQQRFILAEQMTKALIAGRAYGKTSIIAVLTLMRMAHLPRAKFFLSSTTYNQLHNKIWPAISLLLENAGVLEDIHYVVGKRPPKNWPKPYYKVKDYTHVVTFYTGYTVQFMSQVMATQHLGGSFDGGDVDEAGLMKEDFFSRMLRLSVRGNRFRWLGDYKWLHYQINLYTTQPWKPSGYWVRDIEKKANEDPNHYYFQSGKTIENIEVLGQDVFDQFKRDLGPLMYDVEVENEPVDQVEDQFYFAFDPDKHTHFNEPYQVTTMNGVTTEQVIGINPYQPIKLSFDTSGWFKGVTLWQLREKDGVMTEMCDDVLFVGINNDIKDLIKKFTIKYEDHAYKHVRIYGDPRGHDPTEFKQTVYQLIQTELQSSGWAVTIVVTTNKRTTSHVARGSLINDAFRQSPTNELPPISINIEKAKELILSIQLTEKNSDGSKNKQKETDRSFPQEKAPHLGDTMDYMLIQEYIDKITYYDGGQADFS